MTLSARLYHVNSSCFGAWVVESGRSQQPRTNYLPALTTYVRFPNFPASLRTSLADAPLLLMGRWSSSSLYLSLAVSRGNEILIVCELKVNPNASIVESQFVLFLATPTGDSHSSPCPNKRT